jgi:hypothetical protein
MHDTDKSCVLCFGVGQIRRFSRVGADARFKVQNGGLESGGLFLRLRKFAQSCFNISRFLRSVIFLPSDDTVMQPTNLP